jgi:hypothetical protein
MRVLLIKSHIHNKNFNFILNCKKINFFIINSAYDFYNMDISSFDAVYSPCEPINVSQYPNMKFIFGPHFSIFPETKQMDMIKNNKNVLYIQPSDWVVDLWKNNYICTDIQIRSFAFGVDTEKFFPIKPILEREKVFIYFKFRNPHDLSLIEEFLTTKNYDYRIFSYTQRYTEEEYLDYLRESKFGIWLGGHESQGFALEEALSCNVPLLVWNVSLMSQEYGSSYHDIKATSIPYWDVTCGEYFYNINDLPNSFDRFITNLENYKPREYVINNLSNSICEDKLIYNIENI